VYEKNFASGSVQNDKKDYFKMMKALILTTHLNYGGISRYVVNLAKGLKLKGHRVWVGSSGGIWQERLKKEGIDHLYLPINTKSFLSIKVFFSLFFLVPFLLRNSIDVVIANTRVTQFLAYLVMRFFEIKYISVFHGTYKKNWLRRTFKFEGVRTIAVSEAVKEHLIKDLLIKEKKIRVIYNGIDIQEFAKKRFSKKDFGLSSFLTLGVLGRISQEKGHFLVVSSFKELTENYGNIFLLICGEGRLRKRLEEFIEKIGVKERVKFFSLEGRDFLDIVDILVVASSKEGLGMVILEAFAKGVAVVAYPCGGIKEIIKDKVTGFFFHPYSAFSLTEKIEELIKNKDLRERIVEEAKKEVFRFSLEGMTQKTENLLKEVVYEKS